MMMMRMDYYLPSPMFSLASETTRAAQPGHKPPPQKEKNKTRPVSSPVPLLRHGSLVLPPSTDGRERGPPFPLSLSLSSCVVRGSVWRLRNTCIIYHQMLLHDSGNSTRSHLSTFSFHIPYNIYTHGSFTIPGEERGCEGGRLTGQEL